MGHAVAAARGAALKQIGIVGTFDVENYGDLLFPLIAEAELRNRLGGVHVRPFAYHARSKPRWPYDVTSIEELPRVIGGLDALLIGGGFLIRFDKFVADDYLPPAPHIHHPTGYWLTPALMAIAHGVPVAWNAPGMHCNEVPLWAEPLMQLALGESAYVAVRDELSKAPLARFADIEVVPDTAFGIARLLDEIEAPRIDEPYIAVQPIRWRDDDFPQFASSELRDFRLLALPIGPVLGDDASLLGEARSQFVELPSWPHPLTIAKIISNAAAVVGYSYHLAITAAATGVPAFTSVDLDAGKFTALREQERVYPLKDIAVNRIGKSAPAPTAVATLPKLTAHWDRIASIVERGRRPVPASFGRFWQTLPQLLEPPPQKSRWRFWK